MSQDNALRETPGLTRYHIDRFRRGMIMAEDGEVHAASDTEAVKKALRIFAHCPGDTLVLRPLATPSTEAPDAVREANARAIFGVVRDANPDAFHPSFERDQEVWFAAADAAFRVPSTGDTAKGERS